MCCNLGTWLWALKYCLLYFPRLKTSAVSLPAPVRNLNNPLAMAPSHSICGSHLLLDYLLILGHGSLYSSFFPPIGQLKTRVKLTIVLQPPLPIRLAFP